MLRRCSHRLYLSALVGAALGACGPSNESPDSGVVPNIDGAPEAIDAEVNPPDANPNLPDASDVDAGQPGDIDEGRRAYFFGDSADGETNTLVTIDVATGGRQTVPLDGFANGADIFDVAISPDGNTLAVAGRSNVDDAPELHIYSKDGGAPLQTLFVAASQDHVVRNLAFSPNGNFVAFLGDDNLLGANALFVVPSDGSADAKQVSPMVGATNQDLKSYRWASDSIHIAFVGDFLVNNEETLFSVNATAVVPSVVELAPAVSASDADVGTDIELDGVDRVYFRSDFELDPSQFRLYRVALDGSGLEQVLGTALTKNGGMSEASVDSFTISPDGTKIAFASDSPTAELFQIYVMDLSGSSPALVSNVSTEAPATGDRGPNASHKYGWSSDQQQLVVGADWPVDPADGDRDHAVFLLPTSGAPGGIRLAKPLVGSGDAFAPTFSADDSTIVFIGDLATDNKADLYGITDFGIIDQSPASIVLEDSVSNGDVAGVVIKR